MSSVRTDNRDSPITDYEQQKIENIARNKRKLDALRLPTLNTAVQPSQTRKRTKKTNHTSDATTERRNLRPRPQRNSNEQNIADEHMDHSNYEPTGDFLCDNEGIGKCTDLHIGTEKKRKGRGITKMNDIFSRTEDMPKIKITLNEFGQPIGENSRKLSSVIGCLVRKNLSVGCEDWRLVDATKKDKIWTEIKKIYDLDDDAMNWFMSTAGRKWRDFKADLKGKFFDETLTDEELLKRNGDRVNTADWSFLIDYWRSPESQAATARAKACRAQLQLHHTSGSGKELGRPPRRDEVFIKTHTRKNGVPLRQATSTINKLKAIVEDRPELKDRTIQQGDAFAVVCGVKEPRGCVRVLGLGPTPQDIGVPASKSYIPTRLQMEVLARKRVESEKAALEQRIKELEQERMVQERQIAETNSHHGSNSRHHPSPRSEEFVGEAHHLDQGGQDDYADNEDYDHYDENLLVHSHAAAPSQSYLNITTTPTNNDSAQFSHDTLVENDVILYALLRSDQPVAKGTIISTNPNTMVEGESLGKQYCEVIITVVLKRDAILPRPYTGVETMLDAHMMSIAWPYKKLKACKRASSHGTVGSSGGAR